MRILNLLVFVALTFSIHNASAQFTGNVFFDQTNITVNSGDQWILPAMFFAGSDPMGGVEFEVSFDPAVLSLVDITAVDGDFSGLFSSHRNNDGNYAIVVSNQTSITAPTASVPLVNLVFQVIGSSASTTDIRTTIRDSVRTDLTRFPAPDDFITTVTVQ